MRCILLCELGCPWTRSGFYGTCRPESLTRHPGVGIFSERMRIQGKSPYLKENMKKEKTGEKKGMGNTETSHSGHNISGFREAVVHHDNIMQRG